MSETNELSHFDAEGRARMVDISAKEPCRRMARAQAKIFLQKSTLEALQRQTLKKGGAMAVARVAGIQAAKRTDELIPLCHSLDLSWVDIQFAIEADGLRVLSEVRTRHGTGVEMEALVAAQIAATTLYDMCKAVDKKMTISEVMLLEKLKQK